MPNEQRMVCYDHDLHIEAYRLQGIVQKFPNHFHDYYVVGFVESGARRLWCKGKTYDLTAGDLILFSPRDNHYCTPVNGEPLDYRAVNIPADVMQRAAKEVTGREDMPYFSRPVVRQGDCVHALRALYAAIQDGAPALEKQEMFFYLLEQLLSDYAVPFAQADLPEQSGQIRALCTYMEQHYADNITLDELVSRTDCGKSYLLRLFAKQVGVSPYRYLQNIRLGQAKKLLEAGVPPVDAAGLTGFSDQSHFTHYFKDFIGLTPGHYQRIFTGNPTDKEREQWTDKQKNA